MKKELLRGITSERVMAFASVILMVITGWYAYLTYRLEQLQIDPSLEIGVAEPFQSPTEIVLQNTGAKPIRNIAVNMRCFLFKNPNDTSPAIFFVGFPSRGEQHSWWFVPELRPGAVVTKDSAENLASFLANKEVMEKSLEAQKPRAPIRSNSRQAQPTQSWPMLSDLLLVVDVSYHRSVDYRPYHISRPAWLTRDANTRKPFLYSLPISSEYRRFLKELSGVQF